LKQPKVIAFDLFGTVFDMANVPREEIRAYLDHVTKPAWSLLELPESWGKLPPFPDAVEGLRRLATKFTTTTCSNCPFGLMMELSTANGIEWGMVNPLELLQVYKPNPAAYEYVAAACDVKPEELMMVTGNKTFAHFDYGDIEMARSLGMQAQLIRNPGCPQTIIELAEALGC
jgi:2-haloacid dehalogenase